MITFDVRSNIQGAAMALDDVARKQLPFATVVALNATARNVKDAEYRGMQRSFDRPTPFALNSLKTVVATKAKPTATVTFKDGFGSVPAHRFLMPEVIGGPRSQKSHEKSIAPLLNGFSFLVPSKNVVLDAYGNFPAATLRKIVSQLKVSRNSDANASKSKRSLSKRKLEAYFVSPKGDMVLRRHSPYSVPVPDGKGGTKGSLRWQIEPVLIGVRRPTYRPRYPFYRDAQTVVDLFLPANLKIAIERAVANAGSKGKWRV